MPCLPPDKKKRQVKQNDKQMGLRVTGVVGGVKGIRTLGFLDRGGVMSDKGFICLSQ